MLRRLRFEKIAVAKRFFLFAAAFAVPAVGGYSNTFSDDVRRSESDITTVGIVTQVEGGSFSVHGDEANAGALKVGNGVLVGDKIWVEPKALARVTDTRGGRITIAGPAVVEFNKKGVIQIYRGSVKFKSPSEAEPVLFESILISGKILGEAAVWASANRVQLLALAGDVRAWHPKLDAAKISVAPGYYTESSTSLKQLHPLRPAQVDSLKFETFIARFECSVEDAVPFQEIASEGSRQLASAESRSFSITSVERGSRQKKDVVEEMDPKLMRIMQAKLAGLDYDEDDDLPLTTAGMQRNKYDAYGLPLKKKGRGVASLRRGPRFDVLETVKKPTQEQSEDLKKIMNKKH